MDDGVIAVLFLAGLVFGVGFTLLKLTKWSARRGYQNMLRGQLLEDYIKNNPHLSKKEQIYCSCGSKKIVLRNIGPRMGPDVVREHVCHRCGKRLFFSVSGKYLEEIIGELRKEADYGEPTRETVSSR